MSTNPDPYNTFLALFYLYMYMYVRSADQKSVSIVFKFGTKSLKKFFIKIIQNIYTCLENKEMPFSPKKLFVWCPEEFFLIPFFLCNMVKLVIRTC